MDRIDDDGNATRYRVAGSAAPLDGGTATASGREPCSGVRGATAATHVQAVRSLLQPCGHRHGHA